MEASPLEFSLTIESAQVGTTVASKSQTAIVDHFMRGVYAAAGLFLRLGVFNYLGKNFMMLSTSHQRQYHFHASHS
jgi:hypothetical protein